VDAAFDQGALQELISRPATETVARILQAENIFTGRAEPAGGGRCLIRFAGHTLRASCNCRGHVTFMVRPESIRVLPGQRGGDNAVPAVLARVERRMPYWRLEFDAGVPVAVYLPVGADAAGFEPGRRYSLAFPPEALYVFPAQEAARHQEQRA